MAHFGPIKVPEGPPDERFLYLSMLLDGDPLGSDELATHVLPLDEAPRGYELFQRKEEGAIKVVLRP
jgi:threonine dehydrogenase-like Zn-dependent dehydrogenase